MAERLGAAPRQMGMKKLMLALALAGPLTLAGCGDDGADAESPGPEPPSSSSTWCRRDEGPNRLVQADLDGDGTVDDLNYAPPAGECPATLSSSLAGLVEAPTLDWTAAPRPADAHVVEVPGRTGELVLVLEQHPRGGFQAHLFGYADGNLEELEVAGQPIFPFVATDSLSTPIAATCTDGGFAVTEARAHQPIGVAPAWDVYRTTYTVDGNRVAKVDETEVAENLLTEGLEAKHSNLVDHALFEDCLATG